MIRILVTGANSYIGMSFDSYMKQWPDKYKLDTVDMIDGSWKDKDFSPYDIVFHVAGIAHKKETKENAHLYYEVNRDIVYEAAKKAKAEGVKQFIYLSSMSVYGMDTGVITMSTIPKPKNNYGKSKLEAEEILKKLEVEDFKVCIIRPPMVYGKGCKGNYSMLSKVARKFPAFPKIGNKRSMLYIGNLIEFVRLMIDNHESGLFWPTNKEYSNTSDVVAIIAEAHGKKILLIKGLTWFIKLISLVSGKIDKAFGSLVYEEALSTYKEEYRRYSLLDSIKETENDG